MKLATLGACVSMLALVACQQDPATGGATLAYTPPVTAGTVRTYVNEGQLLCNGLAMFNGTGAAILAKGAAKASVDAVCSIVGAVAVSPEGGVKGTATVTLPSSLTIPLKS